MKPIYVIAALVLCAFGLAACGTTPGASGDRAPVVNAPAPSAPPGGFGPEASLPPASTVAQAAPAGSQLSGLTAVRSDQAAAAAGTAQSDQDYRSGVAAQSQPDNP
jgi:hypothetical protein